QRRTQALSGVARDSRDEQSVAASGNASGNLADLLGRLAGAVYDFWKALPQGAMVIDRREGERFGRLERECLERGGDVERPVRNLAQQVADVLAPHTSAVSSGSPSSTPSAPAARYRSRIWRYSSKIPSTSPSDVTACNFFRNSAEPGRPFTYQPKCFRNSIAAPRRSGSYSAAMCACSSAMAKRSSIDGSGRMGRPSRRSRV